MKITAESTDRIVPIVTENQDTVYARIWKGRTVGGVEFNLYVTRVQVEEGQHEEFERELRETPHTKADFDGSIPMRLML